VKSACEGLKMFSEHIPSSLQSYEANHGFSTALLRGALIC